MVCLDPVGTLDDSTIEVPFNLKEKDDYEFKHHNKCTDSIILIIIEVYNVIKRQE
jgi:hypothetical protein